MNMSATAVAHRSDARRSGVTINLRASANLRDLIDRAAALLGQNRTEFMLDSARLRAEDVLLDQRLFSLDEKQYQDFLNLLDEPPRPTEELRKLLTTKAPWER
jgi:uncharacterized protein (DUF1778 family)